MTASHGEDDDALLGRAADWLVTLTSGKATETDARDLAAWRDEDPRHDAAFRHVANLSNLTRVLIDQPVPRVSRRAVLSGGVALMSGGAALGLAKPPLGLWPSFSELMADHRTGAGERYTFQPIAGVSVEMNSKTSVSLADAGRAIDLVAGEAFVSARPRGTTFEVRAESMRASSRDAVFNVQAIDGEIGITCVAGSVECRNGSQSETIGPNEQLRSTAGGMARARVSVTAATAWRDGLLVFEGTPLAEVIRQINRYRSADIVLTNDAIGRRPVNGTFHTAQIENAVSQIQQNYNLTLRRLPGGVVLMS